MIVLDSPGLPFSEDRNCKAFLACFEYVEVNLHYINDEDAIKNNTVDCYQRGMVLDQVKFASK